jgi:hypothetical protein
VPIADDYFAVTSSYGMPLADPDPVERVPASGRSRNRLSVWIIVGVALVVTVSAGTVIVGALHTKHQATIVDTRPLGLPDAIDGVPLANNSSGMLYRAEPEPRLAASYGGSTSEWAVYLKDPKTVVALLAGRGPIGKVMALGISTPSSTRRVFGDVTCANVVWRGKSMLPSIRDGDDIPDTEVCWYSSPTFSVSISFLNAEDDSASHAQALDAVLPTIRHGVS